MGWAGCYASGAEETLPFFVPSWGLPGDGQAPVKELDSWGPGKVPTSTKGPCHSTGLAQCQADRSVVHHVLSLPFPQSWGPPPRSQVVRPQLQGQGHHGPGALCAPLMLQNLGQGRPGASDLHT